MNERELLAQTVKPAEAVRTYRQREGLTQDQLAERMGISRITVNQIENERQRITAITAVRLERVFRVSARWWLDRQADVDLARARTQELRERQAVR